MNKTTTLSDNCNNNNNNSNENNNSNNSSKRNKNNNNKKNHRLNNIHLTKASISWVKRKLSIILFKISPVQVVRPLRCVQTPTSKLAWRSRVQPTLSFETSPRPQTAQILVVMTQLLSTPSSAATLTPDSRLLGANFKS